MILTISPRYFGDRQQWLISTNVNILEGKIIYLRIIFPWVEQIQLYFKYFNFS